MEQPNPGAVKSGGPNLAHHVKIVRSFGVPVVVAINRFDTDSPEELAAVREIAAEAGANDAVAADGFAQGGAGMTDLAEALTKVATAPADVTYAYPEDASAEDKVLALAQKIYGADAVSWTVEARRQLRRFESQGWGHLPICMAKTHLSTSHDPTRRGSPSGYVFPITDIRASVGGRVSLCAGWAYRDVAWATVSSPGARHGRYFHRGDCRLGVRLLGPALLSAAHPWSFSGSISSSCS